jgi:integrase
VQRRSAPAAIVAAPGALPRTVVETAPAAALPAPVTASRRTVLQVVAELIAFKTPDWESDNEPALFRRIGSGPLGSLWIDELETADVDAFLKTCAKTIADRLFRRICNLVEFANAKGYRDTKQPNPARPEIKEYIVARPDPVKHQPALPLDDIPALMADLKADGSPEARALALLILTGCRTSEAIALVWSEINVEKMLWTMPVSRDNKGKRGFVAPLAPAALELLGKPSKGLVFGRLKKKALIQKLQTLRPNPVNEEGRRAVSHGFRSALDGYGKKNGYSKDLRNAALNNRPKSGVDAAYDREALVEERRPMMTAYADFLMKR